MTVGRVSRIISQPGLVRSVRINKVLRLPLTWPTRQYRRSHPPDVDRRPGRPRSGTVIDPSQFAIWAIALSCGAVFGLAFTRAGRALAHRVGLVDAPDGRRKTQTRPVPVVGGV